MPLVPTVLKSGIQGQLQPLLALKTKDAFSKAMKKFKDVSAEQNGGNEGKDVFSNANQQASQVFSDEMAKLANDIATVVSTNVDLYIKSATIIIPPGILVATVGSPGAQAGSSTAPSPPAIIT